MKEDTFVINYNLNQEIEIVSSTHRNAYNAFLSELYARGEGIHHINYIKNVDTGQCHRLVSKAVFEELK